MVLLKISRIRLGTQRWLLTVVAVSPFSTVCACASWVRGLRKMTEVAACAEIGHLGKARDDSLRRQARGLLCSPYEPTLAPCFATARPSGPSPQPRVTSPGCTHTPPLLVPHRPNADGMIWYTAQEVERINALLLAKKQQGTGVLPPPSSEEHGHIRALSRGSSVATTAASPSPSAFASPKADRVKCDGNPLRIARTTPAAPDPGK